MRISDFLHPAAIEADLGASNKAGVLRELVGLILKVQPDLDPNHLVDTLQRREKLQSTGIGEGVAIPHGKTDAVGDVIACVGRSRGGVDFQSLDGQPTHLFFTLIVPESKHGLHLKALARVSRLLKDATVRQALLDAPDAGSLYAALLAEDEALTVLAPPPTPSRGPAQARTMLHPEVTVGELVDALAPRGYRLVAGLAARPRPINQATIQRVGVALTGYTVHLEHDRVQMMGRAELGYLWSQPPDKRRAVLDALAAADFPALVVTTDLEPPPELCQVGDEQPFAVILTDEPSTVATERVNAHLHRWLAVRASIHGVLIDVFGVGVLILGKSGIGKSEVALELVAAGHRLVSDDVVILEQESNSVVVGAGPDLTRYHMEIRGLGILNIKDLFGAAAVRERKRVELVCELMEWDPTAHYDRVGLDTQRMMLAGVPVTHLTLPVRPGRSLKLIIEVAARDRLLKAQGTHSAQAFAARLQGLLTRGAAPVEVTPPLPEETDLE